MYRFTNDYNEIAHPKLLSALLATSNQKNGGYGLDSYCNKAEELIKTILASPTSAVHFLPGGTITNLIFISHLLRPYQAVIAADTGHIAVHETGAIEASGHKVLTIKCANDGKLTPELIKPILDEHSDEHMVQPKLVYISNTTEVGTIYTKQELKKLSEFCKQNQLYFYLDGARLAMALAAQDNDLTLADLSKLTDAFYIGGTKVGAFAGEALVVNNEALNQDLRFSIKQKGGLMAKGWILGVQFSALLKDNLYFELGAKSNHMAQQLTNIFIKAGFTFDVPPQTNQLFVNVPNRLAQEITTRYYVYDAGKPDPEHTCLRFCTSWSTTDEDIQEFEKTFQLLLKSN